MNRRVLCSRGSAAGAVAAAFALTAASLAFGGGVASATPVSSDDSGDAAHGQSRVVTDSRVTLLPNESRWNEEQQVDLRGATPGFVQLAAGYNHAAAVSNGGVLYTWGMGVYGQLGNGASGTNASQAVPTAVDATGDLRGVAIKKVAVGTHHTVALGEDGKVYTWGHNDQGQLGDGTRTDRSVPVKVSRGDIPDDVHIIDIGAASSATVALGNDGRVYQWGNLMEKAPSADADLVPVLRTGLEGQFAKQITAGSYDAMVLTDKGLFGWGTNRAGRLGVGDTSRHATPVQVDTSGVLAGKNIVGVSMGISNYAFPTTFAWDSDGKLYSWGSNADGQLGTGQAGGQEVVPVSVTMTAFGDSKVVDVKGGVAHALALTDDDTIYAWGLNRNTNTSSSGKDGGQLGTGDQVNRSVPTKVDMSGELAGQAPFVNIGVGSYASFALGRDGKVFSWGTSGRNFMLGDGRDEQYAYSNVPAKGPWFGSLVGVTFGTADGSTLIAPKDIEVSGSDLRSGFSSDYTTLRFTAPAYGGVPTEARCTPVDVTAEFELMGGETPTEYTAQWPPAAYKYCANAELSWGGRPTAELEDGSNFAEGGQVKFTFTGVASGETGLADTSFIINGFSGEGPEPEMACTPEAVAAGESFVCTGYYTLTAADVAKREVSLTGEVSATYDGQVLAVVDSEKTAALLNEEVTNDLRITKTAAGFAAEDFKVGAQVQYQFLVENLGTHELTDVEVVEADFTGTGELSAVSCPDEPVVLQPEERVVCTATYTLTDADIEAGKVTNTAAAQGVDPSAAEVSSEASSVTIEGVPSLPETGGPETGGPTLPETGDGGSLAETGAKVASVAAAALCLLAGGFFLLRKKQA